MNHEHIHDCQRMARELNEYIDDELAPEICQELQRHLAECPDCHVVLDTLTRTIKLYRMLDQEPAELPDEIETRLFHSLKLNHPA